MGRFAETVVASGSVGSYGLMSNVEARPGGAPSVHIVGNSFNLTLRATNFFNPATNVGSNWTDVSGTITSPGLYHFPSFNYAAMVFQVNSAAAPISLAVG